MIKIHLHTFQIQDKNPPEIAFLSKKQSRSKQEIDVRGIFPQDKSRMATKSSLFTDRMSLQMIIFEVWLFNATLLTSQFIQWSASWPGVVTKPYPVSARWRLVKWDVNLVLKNGNTQDKFARGGCVLKNQYTGSSDDIYISRERCLMSVSWFQPGDYYHT